MGLGWARVALGGLGWAWVGLGGLGWPWVGLGDLGGFPQCVHTRFGSLGGGGHCDCIAVAALNARLTPPGTGPQDQS